MARGSPSYGLSDGLIDTPSSASVTGGSDTMSGPAPSHIGSAEHHRPPVISRIDNLLWGAYTEHARGRIREAETMTPTATAPSPPNLLTFLIADIRGYSTFTRERGDGAAALLAQKFADLARDAVEARSGRVIELRGDEAFAVFGSVAQAVRAAVELQATFTEESRADPVFQLPVGIGIDAGEAVPVERGYRGIAVNMAARLCSSAAAGEVLVTRTVADLVQDADDVVFAERGRSTFKGFEEPVEVIEALAAARGVEVPPPSAAGPEGETAGAGALPPELDPMTPMVDREREMRWLRGTWRQVRRGRGRVLVVSGPAQIGKTRLAAEFASYVSATRRRRQVRGSGRCRHRARPRGRP